MTVKCHCCGGTTETKDGDDAICVRCVMELLECRPVTPLPVTPAAG